MNATDIPEDIPFDTLAGQPEACQRLAQAICQRHHVAAGCQRIDGGSALLFATPDGLVLKIFPPDEGAFQRNEAVFLAALARRLPVSVPSLVATGQWGAYPYILMTRLDGVPLGEVWDGLAPEDRLRLMGELGETVRALHALPAGLFAGQALEWEPFIGGQWALLLEHHRAFGLGEEWLEQIANYVHCGPHDCLGSGPAVPLHTELMPQHVFVTDRSGRWTVSGLIDFEPAMTGHPEYEFASAGVFLTRGDKPLLRQFLSAYGYAPCELDGGLSRRLMVWLLLHRYCRLDWFISMLPDPAQRTSLAHLEQFWFGL